MKSIMVIAVSIVFFMCPAQAVEVKTVVSVADHIRPEDNGNALPGVQRAVQRCKELKADLLVFPKGRYEFRPLPERPGNGIVFQYVKNLTLEGNGSEFVFHGRMSAFDADASENIRLRNFSIDWDRPFISQGKIVAADKDGLDLQIDGKLYPYKIVNNRIRFTGDGWDEGVHWFNLYDDKQDIAYRTTDAPLNGKLFSDFPAEEIKPGVIRIRAPLPQVPPVGSTLTMWHGRYIKNCISFWGCKNVSLENIQIYHSPSLGVYAVRTENVTLKNVNTVVNEKQGRVFSLLADSFHFTACKGLIDISHCTGSGMGDDFVNVHGMNIVVTGRLGEDAVEIPPHGRPSSRDTIAPGDELWFVDRATMQRKQARTIKAIDTVVENERLRGYKVTFTEKLPADVSPGDLLENKTWTPDVRIANCTIPKKNRARGVLVTTPGKVVIEHNDFRTAGAAILIEGDTSYWFESGACADVLIQNNVFEDCFTSTWGEAVITITPSVLPADEKSPAYHRNIRIQNNTFKHFDWAILFARSVDGLVFAGNTLEKTVTYVPYSRKTVFYFDGCRNVEIKDNKYAADFPGKNVTTTHMSTTDIRVQDTESLTLESPDKPPAESK